MDQQSSPHGSPEPAPATEAAGQTPPEAPAGATPTGTPTGAATPTSGGTATAPAPGDSPPQASLVSIDQFGAIDLRVALVQGYERVAGTDRLLKLDIDLGDERRTIVSGIAHLIDPETLVGRRIVVVANLQPARIRGVESRGMLLAAGGRGPGEAFALVTVPDTIAPGTRVS